MSARPACLGSPEPPLHTTRLLLRGVEPEDAGPLARMGDDVEVARFTLNLPHPLTEADVAAFVRDTRRSGRDGGVAVLAVIEKLTGAPMGLIGLEWTPDRTRGEVGYWLGKGHWGRGFASEALAAVLGFGFQTLRLERIEANVCVENRNSRKVLEKAGFVRFGVREEPAPARGRVVTLEEYVLPREDWARLRDAPRPLLLVAAVALVDVEGRVLVARRPEGKHMAGLWEFPGGKVKPGETPEVALARELMEELGIDVAPGCLSPLTFASHAYEDFHLLMPVFGCRVWNGEPRPREGQDIQWVAPNRLHHLPMPPADVPLAALLRDLL